MRKLDKVLEYMENFPSEQMLAFFRATRHFQMWDTIRMKHATDAATPQATDVLKFFEDRFVHSVYDEFNNLHKEPTAEAKRDAKAGEAEPEVKKPRLETTEEIAAAVGDVTEQLMEKVEQEQPYLKTEGLVA